MLLSGKVIENITVITPSGNSVTVGLTDIKKENDYVSCAVQKDSGDDPDVTDGMKVYAKAEKIESFLKEEEAEEAEPEEPQSRIPENATEFLLTNPKIQAQAKFYLPNEAKEWEIQCLNKKDPVNVP